VFRRILSSNPSRGLGCSELRAATNSKLKKNNKQASKQTSLFAQLINKDIISMNNVQGRLPEKPIRPNIAGRLAKKFSIKKTNTVNTFASA